MSLTFPPASSARASGLVGAAGLGAVLAGVGTNPGARWIEPVGALAHLALLPFAAAADAPRWGRAMGYAWLAADAAISVARMNGAGERPTTAARLGGHVLAAAWIGSAAARAPGWRRWLGLAAAATLGGHSFVAPLGWKPVLLVASGPLVVCWLVATALASKR